MIADLVVHTPGQGPQVLTTAQLMLALLSMAFGAAFVATSRDPKAGGVQADREPDVVIDLREGQGFSSEGVGERLNQSSPPR